ncbi:HlyD family efflux transporter periplasmic adaptor subunit, partial [Anaerobium acetethylicum]
MGKQIKTLEQLKDSRLLYEKKLPRFGYIISLTVALLLVAVTVWGIHTPKTYVIKSTGVIQSNNKNYVMSPYTGKISEMKASEGAVVEKGDVLFQVQSTDLNLQVTQLEEQKKSYEMRAAQFQKLVKSIKDDRNYFDLTAEGVTVHSVTSNTLRDA